MRYLGRPDPAKLHAAVPGCKVCATELARAVDRVYHDYKSALERDEILAPSRSDPDHAEALAKACTKLVRLINGSAKAKRFIREGLDPFTIAEHGDDAPMLFAAKVADDAARLAALVEASQAYVSTMTQPDQKLSLMIGRLAQIYEQATGNLIKWNRDRVTDEETSPFLKFLAIASHDDVDDEYSGSAIRGRLRRFDDAGREPENYLFCAHVRNTGDVCSCCVTNNEHGDTNEDEIPF